jgi:ribosomal protein S18 acetylase RimI-like enzyme
MDDVRTATVDEADRLATIAAAGFYDDPVMSWVFPDVAKRLEQLQFAFVGLTRDFLPDRGTVHVLDDACVTFWRRPGFESGNADGREGGGSRDHPASIPEIPYPADVLERLAILDAAMAAAHPHDPHWYLNVISTVPERQGTGLGSRALHPVLSICDGDAVPAYLESSNPRNMSLYRRHGFVQTGEITLGDDAPSLYPMWRDPLS